MHLVDELVATGNLHVLGIKDMAGLLKPASAKLLIGTIRSKYPDLPIHVHAHDTAGIAVASMLAAAEAGADVVDMAIDSMSGMTSQPAMGALISSLEQTGLGTGISFERIQDLNLYWSQVRQLYQCFEQNVKAPDASVFEHEMPGGQYTNLMFQSQQLGLGSQWNDIKHAYMEANMLCGDIVKVTPSSKVVGDLAQFMVANKLSGKDVEQQASELDFPVSVIEFFQGFLGTPPGGFPEPLRSHVIRNRERIETRRGKELPPLDFAKIRSDLTEQFRIPISETDAVSYAMYPKVFEEYQEFRGKFGDLTNLPTRHLLGRPRIGEEIHMTLEQGKDLIIKLLAVGDIDEDTGNPVSYTHLTLPTKRIV